MLAIVFIRLVKCILFYKGNKTKYATANKCRSELFQYIAINSSSIAYKMANSSETFFGNNLKSYCLYLKLNISRRNSDKLTFEKFSLSTVLARHRASTSMYLLTFRVSTPLQHPQYGRNRTAHAAGASILSPARGVLAGMRSVRAACGGPDGLPHFHSVAIAT